MADKVLALQCLVKSVFHKTADDEFTASTSYSSIMSSWNEICSEAFVESYWTQFLCISESDSIYFPTFDSQPERSLISLYSNISEFRIKFACGEELNLPSKQDFQLLCAQSLLSSISNLWGPRIAIHEQLSGNPIDDLYCISKLVESEETFKNSTKYVLDSLSKESIRMLAFQIASGCGEHNVKCMSWISAVLWQCASDRQLENCLAAAFHILCKSSDKYSESSIHAILGSLILRLCQSAFDLEVSIMHLVKKYTVPKQVCSCVCQFIPKSTILNILQQSIQLWTTKRFISASSLSAYHSICDWIECLLQRFIESMQDSDDYLLRDLEMSFVDGLSLVVELQSDKLPAAINMLQRIFSNKFFEMSKATQRHLIITDLIQSLSNVLLSKEELPVGVNATDSNISPMKCQSQINAPATKAVSRGPLKDYLQVLEDLKLTVSQGADSKIRPSEILIELESCINLSNSAPGFETFVHEILHQLLNIQNTEGSETHDDQVKRIILRLANFYPRLVLSELTALIKTAASTNGISDKYSSLDISFCLRILYIVEEVTLSIDAEARIAADFKKETNLTNSENEDFTVKQSKKVPKTRIKAPMRLATLNQQPSKRHYNVFYDVIVSDFPSCVLESAWLVTQRCCQQLFPSISSTATPKENSTLDKLCLPLLSSASNRKYLIQELEKDASVETLNNSNTVDYGISVLLAQALHTIATALLCLNRTNSLLPEIIHCTFHWSMQVAHLLLQILPSESSSNISNVDNESLARRQSAMGIISLRRSCLGAMLTAVERLSRPMDDNISLSPDRTEIENTLEKILVVAESSMNHEKDVLCQKMLVQIIGSILMIAQM